MLKTKRNRGDTHKTSQNYKRRLYRTRIRDIFNCQFLNVIFCFIIVKLKDLEGEFSKIIIKDDRLVKNSDYWDL